MLYCLYRKNLLGAISTVNGTISPDNLGFTLMHKHVMVNASGL